jgi:hypothetical protein
MWQVLSILLGGVAVIFLFLNAVFMLIDGIETDVQRFIIGITGLILAMFFHKNK